MYFLEKQFVEQLTVKLDEQNNIVIVSEVPFTPEQILKNDQDAYKEAFRRWKYEDWLPEKLKKADEILNAGANRGRFQELIEATRRDIVTPFIGSGMSFPTNKPLWGDFLERICLSSSLDIEVFSALLQEGKYEEAASLILNNMPTRLFDEQLEHTFRINSADEIGGAVRYLPAVFKKAVVTLNFDNLLELLYEAQGNRFTQILAGDRVRYFRNFQFTNHCLVKLHGDLAEPDTRILTAEEFDACYAADSTIRENLSLFFRTQKLFFLGCSLSHDRTTHLFEEVASADANTPRHCAFMQIPHQAQEHLNREHFLTRRNIFPIWYNGDHDECIEVLLIKLLNDVNLL